MGDNTHTVAVQELSGCNSGLIHVPVAEQREQGICIDDVVEVQIHDIDSGYVDSASFEGPQVGGDHITIPADFVRSVDLELGETYPITFEKVEESEEDEAVESEEDEAEEAAENLLEQMQAEVSAGEEEQSNETEEETEEEKGLGELFA